MPIQTLDALAVGKKLAAYCNQNRNIDAVKELYSDSIVSVEAVDHGGGMPQTMAGKQAILGKNQWWYENHEVHGGKTTGPYPHGNRFVLFFDYDVTARIGPMAGQRMKIQEAALYTVDNGKIIKEEFFYDMGG